MPDETKKPTRKEAEPASPPIESLSEEDQVRIILEQARQQVKPIVKQEREGEKINRELLNFRMRLVNDS
jgi:hypothetical protein